jgi:hypothetical protein
MRNKAFVLNRHKARSGIGPKIPAGDEKETAGLKGLECAQTPGELCILISLAKLIRVKTDCLEP